MKQTKRKFTVSKLRNISLCRKRNTDLSLTKLICKGWWEQMIGMHINPLSMFVHLTKIQLPKDLLLENLKSNNFRQFFVRLSSVCVISDYSQTKSDGALSNRGCFFWQSYPQKRPCRGMQISLKITDPPEEREHILLEIINSFSVDEQRCIFSFPAISIKTEGAVRFASLRYRDGDFSHSLCICPEWTNTFTSERVLDFMHWENEEKDQYVCGGASNLLSDINIMSVLRKCQSGDAGMFVALFNHCSDHYSRLNDIVYEAETALEGTCSVSFESDFHVDRMIGTERAKHMHMTRIIPSRVIGNLAEMDFGWKGQLD